MDKPRYRGCVVCPYCHSEYIPDRYLRREKGEEKTIERGICPWCCRPRPRKPKE